MVKTNRKMFVLGISHRKSLVSSKNSIVLRVRSQLINACATYMINPLKNLEREHLK